MCFLIVFRVNKVALLKRQGEMEKPMSLFGTLLVLLIVSIVIIVVIIAVIFDRVDQHKQEDLRRKRETAQRRSATVVSIEHKIDWAETIVGRGRISPSY